MQRNKSEPDPDLRIVVLTQTSKRADAILRNFDRRGIRAVVVVDQGAIRGLDRLTRLRQVWRASGPKEAARRILRRVGRAVSPPPRADRAPTSKGASAVHHVADANDATAASLLRRLDPDLIVLGSSRLLEPHIVEIPRVGVLNAHPGLLPAYRGVDVVAWAMFNGDPVGVTVHFVDVGIDTGPIVAQRRVTPEAGDTVATMERKADALAGEMMAEVVSRLLAGETLDTTQQEPGSGRLYTRMTPSQRRSVEDSVASPSEEAKRSGQLSPDPAGDGKTRP